MVNCWFGARWFGIPRVPLRNNPFHQKIPRNPNHQPKLLAEVKNSENTFDGQILLATWRRLDSGTLSAVKSP